MRYSDFIKDPQWPPHAFENNSHFFNSQEEVYLQNSPFNPASPLYTPIHQSPPFQSSVDVLLEEEDDCIYYSDDQYVSQDHKLIHRRIRDDENWEEEKPLGSKKKEKKKKPMVKREYERGRYKILDEATKKKIVEETLDSTIVDVARKYNVSVNNICRWRKRCDRRSGAGRKVTDTDMEEKLLEWIQGQSGVISRKAVQNKAKELGSQEDFKASKGWFERFYKRNKLHLRDTIEILTSTHYRRRMRSSGKVEELQETGTKMEEQGVKLEETGFKMEESVQDFGSVNLFELSCGFGEK